MRSSSAPKNDYSKRLSFKEKFELEQLEKDLEKLEKKKEELTTAALRHTRARWSCSALATN
jgi:hypothetical protein